MKTVDQLNAKPEGELVMAMFQVEELEERLENSWEASTTVETGPTGTTCSGTVTCKF